MCLLKKIEPVILLFLGLIVEGVGFINSFLLGLGLLFIFYAIT